MADKRSGRRDRVPLPVIYAVCEGKRTEINYLKMFNTRRMGARLDIRESSSKNALGVVEYAVAVANRDCFYPEAGDQMWCFFDCDENRDDELAKAGILARSHGFEIAFSNPDFEYWLLCHFECYTHAFGHRDDVAERIRRKGYIPDYKKNANHNERLKPLIEKAIENARKANRHYVSQQVCCASNPSSTVSEFAAMMMEKIRKVKP